MMNKSEIMKSAWEIFHNFGETIRRVYGGTKAAFGVALRRAWAKAKEEVVTMGREDILYAIQVLENKDTWTAADHARRTDLGVMLRAA